MIRSNSGFLLTLLLWQPLETTGVPQSTESRVALKAATTAASCPVTLPPAPTKNHDAMSHFEPGTSRWKPCDERRDAALPESWPATEPGADCQ